MTFEEKLKEELEEKVVDILRAVHVHGVDGDFDGCDGMDKDPPSMSVQTATKKIKRVFSQSLSDYRKELGGELEKMKTSKYPERFSVQHPNICKYCGIKPGKEHLGSCDFLIETNRNYVLDSAISLLQKDKENKP